MSTGCLGILKAGSNNLEFESSQNLIFLAFPWISCKSRPNILKIETNQNEILKYKKTNLDWMSWNSKQIQQKGLGIQIK